LTKVSDIHGVQYTTDKNQPLLGRIFWTLTVIGSFCGCYLLIKDTFGHSEKNPVITAIDTNIWTLQDVILLSQSNCSRAYLIINNSFRYRSLRSHFVLILIRISIGNMLSVTTRTIESIVKNLTRKKCRYWRRKENDLQAMTQFLHIFDCRIETVEAASYFCDSRYDYSVIASSYGVIKENVRSYVHQLESFTRYEWIERQSFCFEGKSSITLIPVITIDGLCFTLNGDQNIFNREM
jgi:predicted nucleic acid-binding protein